MNSKTTILVVDDEAGIRDLLSMELESHGHSVQTAFNGEEALERLRAQKFDLVITDMMMPKLSGMDLLSAIKRAIPDTELIVMTGYGTVDIAVQAMKKGACEFIQKPFNLVDMMRLVRDAIERLRQREENSFQQGKLAQLGQMTAAILHDLKNPLGGIALISQMLLDDESLTEEQKQDLRTIGQQTRDCNEILQSVLRYSRKETQNAQMVSLRLLIDSMLTLYRHELTASGIDIRIEEKGGPAMIEGHAVPLQQVFLNLITNARHALKGRHPAQLTMTIENFEGHATIAFADTGVGISPDHLEKIFDPFFTTKREGEGTGLGLYICRDIMARHGGSIEVRSTPDQGSVFTLRFPKLQAAAEAA